MSRDRKAVPAWLNTAALLMATSCLTPVGAFAACSPSPATSGSMVSCSGADTEGIGDGTQSDIKVSVGVGASVQRDKGNAIHLSDRATIDNGGSIVGVNGIVIGNDSIVFNKSGGQIDTSAYGIRGERNVVVTNGGSIASDMFGVSLYWDGKLINDGTISVVGDYVQAVHAEVDGVIQNNGTIVSTSIGDDGAFGFVFNAYGVVTNDGVVLVEAPGGEAYGVYAYGNNATLINHDTFTVTAGGQASGINVLWGSVTNSGELSVTSDNNATGLAAAYELDLNNSGPILVTAGGRAVGYTSGRQSAVANSGSIIAEGQDGSIGLLLGGFEWQTTEVKNSGTIKADVAITAFQNSFPGSPPPIDLTNSGTIDGDITLFEQSDKVANLSGGKIIGDIDLGGGDDAVINNGTIDGAISLGAGDDIYLKGSKGGQSGGSITGGDGFDAIGVYVDDVQAGALGLSEGFEAAAVFADVNGTFMISSVTKGDGLHLLLMGSGSVVNEASISVDDSRPAVQMLDDNLEFENKAAVTGVVAVDMAADNQSFVNRGQTSGTDDGLHGADGARIVNHVNATINGGNRAIDVGSGTTIANLGDISSPEGIAISAVDGNDILNMGTITATGGTGVGIMVRNNNGVDLDNDGNAGITNFGTINSRGAGIMGVQFGTITNTGTINSKTVGVVADNDFLIRNTGTISGTNAAVLLGTSNDFVNEGTLRSANVGIEMYFEQTDDIDGDGDAGAINEGYIYSGGDGVIMRSDNIFENRNTIEADRDGIAVISHNAGPAAQENVIRNSAIVSAGRDGISIAQGDALIENSGNIVGINAIKGGNGVETVFNNGLLEGAILLGGGNDRMTLQNGSIINGDIDGGAGVDSISAAGVGSIDGKLSNIESLSLSSGDLSLDLTSGSNVGDMFFTSGSVKMTGDVATKLTIGNAVQLSGTATITGTVQNNGTLAPGNSIGILTVNGNYNQGSSGNLFIELGSQSADKLSITGTATLDGSLSTGLVGSDLDSLEGKAYNVVTAGSIAGALDTTGTIRQGFWTLNIQQTGTAVTVTVTDVDLTIGATAPMTGNLAKAIGVAAPHNFQLGGIEFDGGSAPPTEVVEDDDSQSDQQATSLSYDSMGAWESATAAYAGDFADLGDRTPATSMPKTGSAEFQGITKGELTETASGAPEAFVVEGNVMLTANFASGLVNADFTEMEKIDSKGVETAWVDFRARMSIADGTSAFAGTAGTDDGVWNGEAKGGFYGDEGGMPGHAAGMWSMSSPLGQALGGFMAKRR